MNNIAEGFARYSDKEYVHFLNIAQASGVEVKSMAYILLDRKYISEQEFQLLQEHTNKTINLTNGLIRYIIKRMG